MIRTVKLPVLIGSFVTTFEFDMFSSLGLDNSVDTRRIRLYGTHDARSIELPIQAIEEFVTWWINHGPIPKERK